MAKKTTPKRATKSRKAAATSATKTTTARKRAPRRTAGAPLKATERASRVPLQSTAWRASTVGAPVAAQPSVHHALLSQAPPEARHSSDDVLPSRGLAWVRDTLRSFVKRAMCFF